ncbi:MAG: phosphoribosylaminoimidazolesuccinocarboxamide synthase [Proteobacteria bacterium]|nr:phosphoribosylaminoimidazolesuccinocarboxamide synthase [Pseudomonadota bacterium]MDA1132704.1 phosphoribosylaminoimidazolesuccinocarboxamide synthase [Pseudomonadota bacterium]
MTDRAADILAACLTDAEFPVLPGFRRGKVRDSYDLPDGRTIMIATDRQSAFDKVLAAVPWKGQVLTQTAMFWFDATRDLCPNCVLDTPDPNVTVVERLDMLPVEMVVRDYLTGSTDTSIWPKYKRGERDMYGVTFPDGLVKNQKLPQTILTPTTKAATPGGHDAPITPAEIVAQGLLPQDIWDELAEKSLAVFARGREIAAANGLVLVDTKYEFGVDTSGTIKIADEVHTPDSSRYWIADTYAARMKAGDEPESLDKEFLRLWVTARCDPYNEPIPEIPADTLLEFGEKYIRLYERVTGQRFARAAAGTPVRDRIEANLRRAFPEYF